MAGISATQGNQDELLSYDSNYNEWSIGMRAILKYNNLWTYVVTDVSAEPGPFNEKITTEQREILSVAMAKHQEEVIKHAKAANLILGCISEAVQRKLNREEIHDGQKLMRRLEKMFALSEVDLARTINELFCLRHREDDKMSTFERYLAKAQSLSTQLDSARVILTPGTRTVLALTLGLNRSSPFLRGIINSWPDRFEIATSQEVFRRIRSEYEKVKEGYQAENTKDAKKDASELEQARSFSEWLASSTTIVRERRQGNPSNKKENKTTDKCDKCQKSGHLAAECQKKICDKCKKGGHIAINCPAKFCDKCQSKTHFPTQCPKDACGHCFEHGHIERNCPHRKREIRGFLGRGVEEGPQQCLNCHEPGHDDDECPSVVCSYCYESGHAVRSCYLKRRRENAGLNVDRSSPNKRIKIEENLDPNYTRQKIFQDIPIKVKEESLFVD